MRQKYDWLESQTPQAKAITQIKRENTIKEEMLKKKGTILKILDVSDKKQADVLLGQGPHKPAQDMVEAQVNDMIMGNMHNRHLPFKWDPL